MLVAESGRRAGELAVLDSPAQFLRYPQIVGRLATISDACRVGDVLTVPSEGICQIRLRCSAPEIGSAICFDLASADP
jgi:hypothetical protein